MLSKSITTGKHFWRGAEITQGEYNSIAEMIRSRPTAPEGYIYRLSDGLEWELHEQPAEETEEELSDEEALEIIMGGAV